MPLEPSGILLFEHPHARHHDRMTLGLTIEVKSILQLQQAMRAEKVALLKNDDTFRGESVLLPQNTDLASGSNLSSQINQNEP